ncbi:unnamed protein product [Closterium sp. Naga37s-1]|nr:unnamed protein product [Closterium sp. Naga37s-1]
MAVDALAIVASALAEASPGGAPRGQVPALLRAASALAGRETSSRPSRERRAQQRRSHDPMYRPPPGRAPACLRPWQQQAYSGPAAPLESVGGLSPCRTSSSPEESLLRLGGLPGVDLALYPSGSRSRLPAARFGFVSSPPCRPLLACRATFFPFCCSPSGYCCLPAPPRPALPLFPQHQPVPGLARGYWNDDESREVVARNPQLSEDQQGRTRRAVASALWDVLHLPLEPEDPLLDDGPGAAAFRMVATAAEESPIGIVPALANMLRWLGRRVERM